MLILLSLLALLLLFLLWEALSALEDFRRYRMRGTEPPFPPSVEHDFRSYAVTYWGSFVRHKLAVDDSGITAANMIDKGSGNLGIAAYLGWAQVRKLWGSK
jgi:hypothetical protein